MPLFRRIRSPLAEDEPKGAAAFAATGESVGDLLRRQRSQMGLNLGDVAATLRIKPVYLVAIEDGHPGQLPGTAYALGFVRSYSDYLGLDSSEVLRRFKLEAAGLNAKPDLTFPMPLGERSVPARGILIVAFILTICGYGTWYSLSSAHRRVPERVAEVPAGLLALKPDSNSASKSAVSKSAATLAHGSDPAVPAAAPGFAAGDSPSEASPKARSSAPPEASVVDPALATISAPGASSGAAAPTTLPSKGAVAAPLLSNQAGNQKAPEPVAMSQETRPATNTVPSSVPVNSPSPSQKVSAAAANGESDRSSRITLRANATSWIQVRAPDRTVLFTGFLNPGDTYRVPDQPGLSMRAGNAGGLDVMVDGKKTPALGPIGAVRNVSLDPRSLSSPGAASD